MPKKPLCVAILWHMHQPDYSNMQSGEIYLPWTRFHATKDYYDMGALVEEVPGLRLTINVVPSLMDQLAAYGDGSARETYAALTLREASALEEREKAFLLRAFFQLPYKEMLFPYPRYRELLELRGAADPRGEHPAGIKTYSARDYRDLQVWFNLSWCGNTLRRDPEIAGLIRKGKGFSEEDKKRLLEIQFAFIERILPFYRRLMEQQGIELSISPYYHAILPLLCDNRAARESQPHLRLPASPFSSPGDARDQIRRAQARYREIFGRDAAGMWPSEGSISNQAADLACEAGLRWLASDEGVLHNSLRAQGRAGDHLTAEQKYRVYRHGEGSGGPCLFFRDHGLSDLIGFTYSRWDARAAAADFVNRLRSIHRELPEDGGHFVVPVILDGENAWEHYPNNGADFLRALYRALTEAGDLRTVTMSEFLDLEPHREPLSSIVAGSWIYANLATWVGHPEKNRGWEHLAAARNFLNASLQAGADPDRFEKSYREMLIAEGSDWFWWYGDDHPTENAAEFDALFRSHVKNVYRFLGQNSPPELDLPIKSVAAQIRRRDPVHTISPRVDGRITDYFEWLAAGHATPGGGESMHRNDRCLEKIFFGFDLDRFYVRLDLAGGIRNGAAPAGLTLRLQFVFPREVLLSLEWEAENRWRCRVIQAAVPDLRAEFAAGRILELAVPLKDLGVHKPEEVKFAVAAYEEERELERFPANGYLAVNVDPWGLDQREWMV